MNNKLNPNFTQIPNYLFDELMTTISHSELRVLLYVMRRTYGFQKKSDKISISQLMNGITKDDGTKLDYGTGLSNRAIIAAIKTLTDKKIILVDKKPNTTTRIILNLGSDKKSPLNDQEVVTKSHHSGDKKSPQLVTNCHTQKKEKESIQNKDTAFDAFWSSYPKKVNRKTCENLWKTHKLDSKFEVIMKFVELAKQTERWQLGYIKAPDVFIRNESWTDDLEAYKPIKATLKKVDILNY